MNIILSLFLFMFHVMLTFYLAFAYGWAGILAAHCWFYIILIKEFIRLRNRRKEEGWETSEERQNEILEELRKELAKNKRF